MAKKLFIASSKEGLEYASAFKQLLSDHFTFLDLDITCVLWSDRGIFRNGESTLASLEHIATELYACGNQQEMGYAVFILTPDEKVILREKEYYIARDNVIFEYGLFLGKLGHTRTFVLVPPTDLGDGLPSFHMLTDLNGITTQWYRSFVQNANIIQAKEALEGVALNISQDIFEIEKKYHSCVKKLNQSPIGTQPNRVSGKLTSY